MHVFKSMKYAVVLAMLLLFTICTAVFLPTASTAYLAKTAFTDVAAGTSTFAVSFAGGMQTTDEIEVWVNGVENTSASVVWLSGSTLQLVGYSTAAGDNIEFRRVSPKTDNLVDLEAGKTIRASSLMKNFRHVLQIGQEAVDAASDMTTIADDSVDAAIQAAVEAAASASIIDPEKHLYRVANMFTLGSTPATTYTAVYLEGYATIGDGGQGTFIWDEDSTATDNNGTIRAVTGIEPGRWIRQSAGFITPEMFGGDFQAALDFMMVTGIPVNGTPGSMYVITEPLTALRDNAGDTNQIYIDLKGATLDATALTGSQTAITLGGSAVGFISETGSITLKNGFLIGPESLNPTEDLGIDSDTTTTGVEFKYALNVFFDNIQVKRFYKGVKTKFVFPLTSRQCVLDQCYIALHQTDASNAHGWGDLQILNSRYSGVFQSNVETDNFGINTIEFDRLRLEGCTLGFTIDPGDSASNEVRGFVIRDPYIAQMDRDIIRVGKDFTYATPTVRGVDVLGKVWGLEVTGGHWSYTHDAANLKPIVSSATGTVSSCDIAIPIEATHISGVLANSRVLALENYNFLNDTTETHYNTDGTQYIRLKTGANPAILMNTTSANGLMRLRRDQAATTFAEIGNESADTAAVSQVRVQSDVGYGYIAHTASTAAFPNQTRIGESVNGNIKIATTGKFLVNADAGVNGSEQMHVKATGSVAQTWKSETSTAGSMALGVYSNVGWANTKVLEVQADGDIYNTNGTYGALSDRRLKNNIVNAGSQWDFIKSLDFKEFEMIKNPGHKLEGVIAQDLEKIDPGLVKEQSDGMLAVKYSRLFTKAMIALQEAISRIEKLEAKTE